MMNIQDEKSFLKAIKKAKPIISLEYDIVVEKDINSKIDLTIHLNGKNLIIRNKFNISKHCLTIDNGSLNCIILKTTGKIDMKNVLFTTSDSLIVSDNDNYEQNSFKWNNESLIDSAIIFKNNEACVFSNNIIKLDTEFNNAIKIEGNGNINYAGSYISEESIGKITIGMFIDKRETNIDLTNFNFAQSKISYNQIIYWKSLENFTCNLFSSVGYVAINILESEFNTTRSSYKNKKIFSGKGDKKIVLSFGRLSEDVITNNINIINNENFDSDKIVDKEYFGKIDINNFVVNSHNKVINFSYIEKPICWIGQTKCSIYFEQNSNTYILPKNLSYVVEEGDVQEFKISEDKEDKGCFIIKSSLPNISDMKVSLQSLVDLASSKDNKIFTDKNYFIFPSMVSSCEIYIRSMYGDFYIADKKIELTFNFENECKNSVSSIKMNTNSLESKQQIIISDKSLSNGITTGKLNLDSDDFNKTKLYTDFDMTISCPIESYVDSSPNEQLIEFEVTTGFKLHVSSSELSSNINETFEMSNSKIRLEPEKNRNSVKLYIRLFFIGEEYAMKNTYGPKKFTITLNALNKIKHIDTKAKNVIYKSLECNSVNGELIAPKQLFVFDGSYNTIDSYTFVISNEEEANKGIKYFIPFIANDNISVKNKISQATVDSTIPSINVPNQKILSGTNNTTVIINGLYKSDKIYGIENYKLTSTFMNQEFNISLKVLPNKSRGFEISVNDILRFKLTAGVNNKVLPDDINIDSDKNKILMNNNIPVLIGKIKLTSCPIIFPIQFKLSITNSGKISQDGSRLSSTIIIINNENELEQKFFIYLDEVNCDKSSLLISTDYKFDDQEKCDYATIELNNLEVLTFNFNYNNDTNGTVHGRFHHKEICTGNWLITTDAAGNLLFKNRDPTSQGDFKTIFAYSPLGIIENK